MRQARMIDPQVESDAVIAHRQALTGLTPAQRRAIVIELFLSTVGERNNEGRRVQWLRPVLEGVANDDAALRTCLDPISRAVFSRGFDE